MHHTAVPSDSASQAPGRLRGHQRFHMDQSWQDIAYHFAVDLNGNAYELRDVMQAGDTFTNYDPHGHFLVVCEGDFNQKRPTDALLGGLSQMLAWGAAEHGLSLDTISGHRDHAGTTCPGDFLYAELGAVRDAAQRILDAGVTATLLCGEDGRARVDAIEAG